MSFMSKRPRNRAITAKHKQGRPASDGITKDRQRAGANGIQTPPTPSLGLPPGVAGGNRRASPLLFQVVLPLGLLLVAGAVTLYLLAWQGSPSDSRKSARKVRGPRDGAVPRETPQEMWARIARELPVREKWVPPDWAPETADDKVVDRFMTLHNDGKGAALALLGADPAKRAEAILGQDEVEPVQVDFLLRSDMQIRGACRGEVDGQGGLKDVPGRYTLFTKGGSETPRLRVKTADGFRQEPQRVAVNLDLIVDVRGGKIYGVRADISQNPP
jgi:hypothetical protein